MCKPKSEGGERCSTHLREDISKLRKQLTHANNTGSEENVKIIQHQLKSLIFLLDETRGGLYSLSRQILKENDMEKRIILQQRKDAAYIRRKNRILKEKSDTETKRCYRCKFEKPYSDFAKHKSNKDGFQNQCKQCQREMARDHYLRTPEQNGERMRATTRRREVVSSIKNEYLKSGSCIDCGKVDIDILEFDHVRGTKIANLAFLASLTGSSRINEKNLIQATHDEIAKCDIRCGNCHRIKTSERYTKSHRIRYREGKSVPPRHKVFYDAMTGGCVDCKETNILVLELDHVRGEKVKSVSKMLRDNDNINTIRSEILKCETRCVNCHKKVTKARKEDNAEDGLNIKRTPRKQKAPLRHCECGNKLKSNDNKFCKTCESNARYQSIDNVVSIYKERGSFVAVGKYFGVSDNAVRKYLSSKGIDPKSLKNK